MCKKIYISSNISKHSDVYLRVNSSNAHRVIFNPAEVKCFPLFAIGSFHCEGLVIDKGVRKQNMDILVNEEIHVYGRNCHVQLNSVETKKT